MSSRIFGSPATPAAAERALLDRYCVTCHNQKLKTGGLALDGLDLADIGGHAAAWEKVVRKLRLFHRRAPELNAEFNVFRRVEMLTGVSRQKNCKFPFDFDWIMQQTQSVEQALRKDPYVPTPCHNDLLNLNWLEEEVPGEIGEVRLLDWEYAGMGDIFFDLSNFSHHHRLTEDQVRLLLQEYFGEVTPKNYARLRLMWPMSELHEAMWGTAQTGISTLGEDFQGYADLWFARVRQHMTDPRWERWLEDVSTK